MIQTKILLLAATISVFLPITVSGIGWVSVEEGRKFPHNAFTQRIRGSSKGIHFCLVKVSTGQSFIGTVRAGNDYCEYVVPASSQILETFESLKVHQKKAFKVLTLDTHEKVIWVNPKLAASEALAVPCPGEDGVPFATCHLGRSLSSDGMCQEGIGKAMSIPSTKYRQVHLIWKNEHHLCPFFLLMGIKTI